MIILNKKTVIFLLILTCYKINASSKKEEKIKKSIKNM